MPTEKKLVYSKEVIEFTTVAVEYCITLEQAQSNSLKEFLDKLSKILPLLYLKAQLVPDMQEEENYGEIETPVTEEDYRYILDRIASVLGQSDDYLEVFHEDMAFSETPIIAHISENLADIYQDLRNFAAVFERGIEEYMEEALFICLANFKEYWGQILVNVMRAIHSIKYNTIAIDESEQNYNEEEW